MVSTIPIDAAQARLKDLIRRLAPGEAVIITDDQRPVARLVSEAPPKGGHRPPPGLGKGFLSIVSDDDDHLRDFADHMP